MRLICNFLKIVYFSLDVFDLNTLIQIMRSLQKILIENQVYVFIDFSGNYRVILVSLALVQFDGERYVIEIAGQIGLYLSYVIDPINPKMKAMIWTFYDSSAQYATLLIFNIIRPIPQRIMVAVSFTNVRTVRSISPRRKIPSSKV